MLRDLRKALLIGVLCALIVKPAGAESLDTAAKQIYTGIAVVSAVIVVGVVLIVLHEKHKTRTITGCVTSGAGGISLTDDRDKRTYPVSGAPSGIKTGNRMTLEGKRRGTIFEARSVIRDLGLCPP